MARGSDLMACYQATKLDRACQFTGRCEIKTLEGYYNVKVETLVAKLA